MLKNLNESFDKKYFIEADITSDVGGKPQYIRDMEKQLHELAVSKMSQGITNIKDYEYGFQSVIESFFPDYSWWEITDCNIFWTLFETKDVDETVDRIIEGIKPEFLKDDVIEKAESKKTDIEAEKALNDYEAEYGADGYRAFRDVERLGESKSLKELVDDDKIKKLKYELADIQKSLKNGENPERLNYRKNKIIDELQKLGCEDGWYEYVNESTSIEESHNKNEINKIDSVRKTYMKYYPEDDLGLEIDPNLSFEIVYDRMKNGEEFYDIVDVDDSIIRERIFKMMSNAYGVDYDHIYYMWLDRTPGLSESLYRDHGSGIVEPGQLLSSADLLAYWRDNRKTDPVLANYKYFGQWERDTVDNYLELVSRDREKYLRNESLKESSSKTEDEPHTYKQMWDELKSAGVLDKEKGSFSVMFEKEKEHCKKILNRAGYKFEVSGDDRTVPQWFHFEYWKDEKKPVKEDTVKQGNYWVNKGKEGTHGKFRTKKQADAQRKAMFAQGYQEKLGESLIETDQDYRLFQKEVWDDAYDEEVLLDFLAGVIDELEAEYDGLFVEPSGAGASVTVYATYTDKGGKLREVTWMEPREIDAAIDIIEDSANLKMATERMKRWYRRRLDTAKKIDESLQEGTKEAFAYKYYDRITEQEAAEAQGFDSVEEFRENDYMDEAAENYGIKRVAFLKAKPKYFDVLDNDGYAFVDLVSDGKKEFVGFYAGGRLYDIEDEIKQIVEE